jgi:hypothetical protein
VEASHFREPAKATRGELRASILQDFYKLLPQLGFSVFIFSSVDGDELFLCVSLLRDDTAESYLERNHISRQVQTSILGHLDVSMPMGDPASTPPGLPFDRVLVTLLHKSGVLERDDPKLLYETYSDTGARKVVKDRVVSSKDCIWIIERSVEDLFDIGAAIEAGLVQNWYPVHKPESLKTFHRTWARFSLMMDLSFMQPIHGIKEYFGVRIAFMFAWTGCFCKSLLMITLVGVLWDSAKLVLQYAGMVIHFGNVGVGFSLMLTIWARVALNLWAREETFFQELWEVQSSWQPAQRPQFKGEYGPSKVDANLEEKYDSPVKAFFRKATSWTITSSYCLLVMVTHLTWLRVFHGQLGSNKVASLTLTITIQVFAFMFGYIVQWLTVLENHKYKSDHFDSYLAKRFVFQCVNNYSAFFFMTLHQGLQDQDSCSNHDCLSDAAFQIMMVLILLSLCSVASLVWRTLRTNILLAWEDRKLRRQGKTELYRPDAEKQAKYAAFTDVEEVEAMIPLVTTLGFVLIFSPIAPITILFCLLVFSVQLRSVALQLTTTIMRPFPRRSRGIGAWNTFGYGFTVAGAAHSGWLLVAYGSIFEGKNLIAKLGGFIIFTTCVVLAWALVDVICPPKDPVTRLLWERRTVTQSRLQEACRLSQSPIEICDTAESLATGRDDEEASFSEVVGEGKWSQIKALQDMRGDIPQLFKEGDA